MRVPHRRGIVLIPPYKKNRVSDIRQIRFQIFINNSYHCISENAGSIIIKNPDPDAAHDPSAPSDPKENRVDGYNSIAIGNGASVIDIDNDDPNDEDFGWNSNGNGSIAMGYNALVHGAYGVAIGDQAEAWMKSVALGNKAKALAQYSVAIGSGAQSTGENAYSLGHGALASGNRSYALGWKAVSSFESTFAFGTEAKARHEYAYAIGNKADASGQFAYAIGHNAKATGDKSLEEDGLEAQIGDVYAESLEEKPRRCWHAQRRSLSSEEGNCAHADGREYENQAQGTQVVAYCGQQGESSEQHDGGYRVKVGERPG